MTANRDAPTPDIPGLQDLTLLGEGGFGRVYRAWQVALDREVAVKIVRGLSDSVTEERFRREAAALGRLSGHPNIVTVYEVGETAQRSTFIVMQFVAGGSLQDRLDRKGPMPWRDAVRLGASVASALGEAHAAGILHRDVKPDNILFDRFGTPLLADFGIARLSDATQITASGAVAATLAFAPPEVFDRGTPGPSTDIYSLGATMVAAIRGRPAFTDDDPSMHAMLARIINSEPPGLEQHDVSPQVEALLRRSMAKSPNDRPTSAGAFREELLAALKGSESILRSPVGVADQPLQDIPAPQTAPQPTETQPRPTPHAAQSYGSTRSTPDATASSGLRFAKTAQITGLAVLAAVLLAVALRANSTGPGPSADDLTPLEFGSATESTVVDVDNGEGPPESDDRSAVAASRLTFGTTDVPSTIDPAAVYEKFASDVLFNTTNRLVEFAPGESEPGPGLAESFEISDDGLTYTFNLREGVTFHDGSEMTAEDVVYSLNRSLNINHPDGASLLINSIESIEARDDFTVVITISQANSTFLSRLNYTVGSVIPSDSEVYDAPDAPLVIDAGDSAAAESQLEQAESFITRNAIVGTGPYEMVSYDPGSGITLQRFENYWGDAPDIDTIEIQFFESTTQMRNALAGGEIDLAVNDLDPIETASLVDEVGIQISTAAGNRTSYIVIDVTQPPFDDPDVRRAFAATIDRERIVEEAFEGQASPLGSMIPENFDVSTDYITDVEFDLSVGDPVEFELWYPADRYTNQAEVAETIARSLNESGLFNVTTSTAEWATEYATHLGDGAYSAYLLGWYPDYLDPLNFIEPFYHSERTFIGFYGNPEMNALIEEALRLQAGTPERAEVLDRFQQLAARDMPFIPLYSEGQEAYYRDHVQGVDDTLGAAQQTWFYVLSLM